MSEIKPRRDWIDKQTNFPWIQEIEQVLFKEYNPPVSGSVSIPQRILPEGSVYYDTDDGHFYSRVNGDWEQHYGYEFDD